MTAREDEQNELYTQAEALQARVGIEMEYIYWHTGTSIQRQAVAVLEGANAALVVLRNRSDKARLNRLRVLGRSPAQLDALHGEDRP